MRNLITTALILLTTITSIALAQEATSPPKLTLISNVNIFDGNADKLHMNMHVLVKDNLIETISAEPLAVIQTENVTMIDGGGRTLMPGLIDNHWHVMFAGASLAQIMGNDDFYIGLLAAQQAEATLMRGFTTVRDLGGNSFSVKKAIDEELYPGPRIYPAGPMISQTSGHADFRSAHEHPLESCAALHTTGKSGHLIVADGVDQVLFRVREALKKGATHIKLAAGGGTSSQYDPLDVAQFTFEELKAAVDAASDWDTYVSVHAYTPKAVQRSIRAGVKVIEHGQLLDEETIKIMAQKDIWLSLQPFYVEKESPLLSSNPVVRSKQLQMLKGTANAYALAKKHGLKVAFGTDFILSPGQVEKQGEFVTLLETAFHYAPYEALKQATSDNAQLLKLSGLRNPYPGELGLIKEGAFADLLLVNGNPLKDLNLIKDPHKNFDVIMKNGKIYKNAIQ